MATPRVFVADRAGRVASADRIREARETERTFRDALTAGRRGELGSGKIAAPPDLERVEKRWGGGYRSKSSEYDWFYGLARDEQSRIRKNWFTSTRGAISPDEMEDLGLPVSEWLALTRGIDAAKAVQTGRQLKASRYGGRDPMAFLTRGRPEDHGTRVRTIRTRRAETPDRHVHHSEKVQFFTDENGVVHPIRASYQHAGDERFRPVTAEERRERYGDDEAF